MKLVIKIMLLIMWVSQTYGQCPATDVVNSALLTTEDYEASDWITSENCIVAQGAIVTYNAGNFIELNPLFEADANDNATLFIAQISPCKNQKENIYTEGEITLQNFPNPFTEQTVITFTLTKDVPVTLLVYDSMGREVASLLNTELMTTGRHERTFDGTDYPSGVYYYTIQAGGFSGTQKMTLMR